MCSPSIKSGSLIDLTGKIASISTDHMRKRQNKIMKNRLSGVFRKRSNSQSISRREQTGTPTTSNLPVPGGRFTERMNLRQVTEAAALDLRKEQRREKRREEGIRRLDELLADLSQNPDQTQFVAQGLIDRAPTPTPQQQHHRPRLFEGSLSPIEEECSSKSSRSSHGDRASIFSTVRSGNSLVLNILSSTLM